MIKSRVYVIEGTVQEICEQPAVHDHPHVLGEHASNTGSINVLHVGSWQQQPQSLIEYEPTQYIDNSVSHFRLLALTGTTWRPRGK